MNSFKKLILILLVSVGASSAALGSVSDICMTEFGESLELVGYSYDSNADSNIEVILADEMFLLKSAWRCEQRDGLLMGLDLISMTFEFAALGSLVCTGGVGAPAAVTFGSIGLITHFAKFMIKNLPCEDGDDDAAKQLVKEQLCELIIDQGGNCDLKKVKLKSAEPGQSRKILL